MSNKVSRLKVLHIIPSVAPCRGGPSKAVCEMVAALRELNVDAEIATTNDDGSEELNVELNKLITYQGVPIRFFKRYSPNIGAVREFAYSAPFKLWLREHIHDYDVMHVHAIFSYCSSYAMRLARKNNIAYVVRPIGQLESWSLAQSKTKKALYLKVLEKANIEAASAVHFTAESEKQQALKCFAILMPSVIPLGIPLPAILPTAAKLVFEQWQIEPHTPCLLYLSRLHPKKGLELLIQALARLNTPNVQLIIAGEGDSDYTHRMKKLCVSLGVEQQCNFIGFVEGKQKNALLQRADLFCLTSYSENFGIAVLEAMANGTAPLISNEVALSSAISTNSLGFVCDLNEKDISAKLALALTDLGSAQEIGTKARSFVAQHYQWSTIAQQLQQLYERIAK